MNLEEVVEKWDEAREKLDILEKKLQKYKTIIAKEMNNKNTDKLSIGRFHVSRRRNTRTYMSKESVPVNIWKEYATKCSYDAFFLTKNK